MNIGENHVFNIKMKDFFNIFRYINENNAYYFGKVLINMANCLNYDYISSYIKNNYNCFTFIGEVYTHYSFKNADTNVFAEIFANLDIDDEFYSGIHYSILLDIISYVEETDDIDELSNFINYNALEILIHLRDSSAEDVMNSIFNLSSKYELYNIDEFIKQFFIFENQYGHNTINIKYLDRIFQYENENRLIFQREFMNVVLSLENKYCSKRFKVFCRSRYNSNLKIYFKNNNFKRRLDILKKRRTLREYVKENFNNNFYLYWKST